jgi:uncharacterized protein (TIGR02118 family)
MIKKEKMVKIVAFIRRNPKLSPQEFKDYWLNVHVPMVKDKLPGLIHYTGSFPLQVKSDPSAILAPYDGLVELCFDSVENMEKAMQGPLFQRDDRKNSSATLMDLPRTESLVMEEYVVQL